MKLLKIGSSPSCDIVLDSEFVSGLHAEITVLDNGDIVLEDKHSTNGTFVGNKKISPNQEITIRRGDYVKFADTDLVWSRIPSPEKAGKYKSIINIGSNFRNDIVINSASVSRYHATLKIDKNGKAFLVDNESKNGTQVNGMQIKSPTRIKRGDNIMCAGEDITEQLRQFLPPSFPVWARVSSGIVVAAAVVALAVLFLPDIIKKPGSGNPTEIRPSVVYVRAAFHYNVTIEDNPFTDEESKDLLILHSKPYLYQATAFFLDKDGRMATNRHIAVPWDEEYREDKLTEELKEEYNKYILNQLKVNNWQFFFLGGIIDAVPKLRSTSLGQAILNSCSNISELQAKIKMIENSKVVISGELDFITVGYPGQNYTHEDEFQRCFVLSESGNKEIDLAILQLNTKKTPEDILKKGRILDPSNIFTGELTPLKEKYCVIGYPMGLTWGHDENTHSLEPNIRNTECTKMPSKYTFEFDANTVGGSSGSPLFNTKGQLVGVLSAAIMGQTVSFAVHAKYLKKMYEEEVGIVK